MVAMDAGNGVPGRPLAWLPSGLTALVLSLERSDSLTVQLKAFSVTQAVKALLSVKGSRGDLRRVPSAGFSRTSSLDALRELAKPWGGYGLRMSGFHSSPPSGCMCDGEEFCDCGSVCGCGGSDCPACESCPSEEDEMELYEEQRFGPETQYQWGIPLAMTGPCSRSQRFASAKWASVTGFAWASPLERRAALEWHPSPATMDGSPRSVSEETVGEDPQEDSENSPCVVRRRKDGRHVPGTRAREGASVQKKVEERCEVVSEPCGDVKGRGDVTPAALRCERPNWWWPFGVHAAAAAPVDRGSGLQVANCDSAKWNFRMGQNAGAGALAGGVVSLCLHPVDTLKTIVQAQTGGSRNLLPILSSVISDRGLKGLYRGLGSNLTSSAPVSAIYTLTYEAVKAGLLRHIPEDMSALAHCAAGGCASVATSIVYTPSECVKQQMQVNGLYQNSWRVTLQSESNTDHHLFGMTRQAFTSLLKQGGLPMLYKGWGAVLCRNVPQSVIKFYTYEGLKLWAQGGQPRDTPLTTLQALAIGGAAGSTAAFFTTPFDVVKTRLQTQIPGSVQQYNGVIHAFQSIAATEGVAGLYRGLVPRLLIYVTQGALFFASYEFIKHVLAVEVPRLRIKASQIEGYQRQPASIPAEST